jgi:hypothetical protein
MTVPRVTGPWECHTASAWWITARVTERSYCGVTATLIAKSGEKREKSRPYCEEKNQEYGKIHVFPLQERERGRCREKLFFTGVTGSSRNVHCPPCSFYGSDAISPKLSIQASTEKEIERDR